VSPIEGADSIPAPSPDSVASAAPAELYPESDDRVPLRLSATRGGLGLELYQPIEIGPL